MAERDLVVRIIGDDRDLQRAFTNTERRTGAFESRMNRLNQSLRGGLLGTSGIGGRNALLFGSGAFIGTATITRGIRESVSAASDLNEQVSKSRQIFGDSSREIEAWSETTAEGIGIAQREALAATGTFGNLFRVVDLAPEKAAEMSRSLVQLAADLASFNNASPEEVLTALRSGLIGEAEPLRRFGVLLSEARVQQVAMAESGKKNADALTNQEKALARYRIILEDTAPAQGDFERTSEGLANQSRILRARLNDLSADIGNVLIPGLLDAAAAAQTLFDAMDALPGLFERIERSIPGGEKSLLDVLGLGDVTFDEGTSGIDVIRGIRDRFQDAEDELRDVEALSPGRAIGEHLAELEEQRAKDLEKAQRDAERAQERQRTAFDAFVKGMGLKLDRARLTDSLNDDLAALRELERAILRQIQREGRTFELVEQLTAVRLDIKDTIGAQADQAQDESRQAFEDMIGALELNLQRAVATSGFADDIRALQQLEQELVQRIASEGSTLELERQLLDVRQQQAEVRREQNEVLREARQGRQFEALGLTAEGDERVAGVGALRRRLGSLREQIKGTLLDTEDTRAQLDRIQRVLSGKFGEVGREVRQSILQMFNDIADALEEGSGREGPLTKFQKAGAGKLLAGLGLSEEEIKALRQRLAQVGPGGTVPGQGIGAFGFNVTAGGGGNIIVQGDIVVQDPRDADAFIREVQKKAGRSAGSRRGTRAGSNRGMG